MIPFDIPGPLKNLLPGALDSWRGPYATVAAANAAIKNTVVMVDGVPTSFRKLKIVDIGNDVDGYTEFKWIGGDYGDDKLVPTLFDVLTKSLFPNIASIEGNFVVGKNKFNKNGKITEGYYLSTGGSPLPAANSSYSDYIPVVPGNVMTASGITAGPNFVFYDSSKTFISSTASLMHTIPANATTVRFNTRYNQTTPNYGAIQYEIGSSATAYTAYALKLSSNNVEQILPDLTPYVAKANYPGVLGLESKFIAGKNKFNGVVTEGGYLNTAGVFSAFANSSYSDYQPVTPGTTETVSGLTYDTATGFVVVFYDANKVKLTTGGVLTGSANKTHVIPAGAAFKRYNTRFNQATPSYGTIMSALGTDTAYEAYYVKLSSSAVEAPVIPDQSIATAKVADKAITPDKTSFFLNRQNLFDKDTMVTTGALLNNSDGVIVASTAWAYVTVPVDPAKGNIVVTKGASNVTTTDDTLHFFNSSGVRVGTSATLTAAIPATAATLKVNLSQTAANITAARNSFMVEYGTVAGSTYVAYGVPNTILPELLPTTANALAGKTVTWVGDSIVHGTGGYTSFVEQVGAKLGISVLNRGDNGATIANIYPQAATLSGAQLTYQFVTGSNACVFSAGTNDFFRALPIGTYADGANGIDTTVKGSLYKAITWLRTNAPACKILFLTPIERSDKTDANAIGLKLIDYRNAIIDVCNIMGVPYLDMYYNNLISVPTAYKYLQSDGLHPNDGGYLVMTDVIAPVVAKLLMT
jgi:lysophospholipase L1-like esterase